MEKVNVKLNDDLREQMAKNRENIIKAKKEQLTKLDKNKIIDLLDFALISLELEAEEKQEQVSELMFNGNRDVIGESRYGKYKRIKGNVLKDKELMSLLDNKTFDNFVTDLDFRKQLKTEVLKYCNDQDYKKEIQGNLMLVGSSGYGKTHLASAVCREFVLRGKQVKYVQWLEEVDRVKYSQFEERNRVFEPLYNAEVLYIDDFLMSGTVTRPSASDINIALKIIDSRVKKGKQTIMTTNWTLEELYEISDLLGGRIQELFTKENIIVIPYHKNGNYRKNF